MLFNEDTIIALKNGDYSAFSSVYNCFWKRVYSFASQYITYNDEINDIVQEVFIKLWEKRQNINEKQGIEGLLFIITKNVIFDGFRKKKALDSLKMNILHILNTTYDMESEINAKDLRTLVEKTVDTLPPRQKEVFLLSRKNVFSRKEIALKLGITEKAVDRNIYLALMKLKNYLKNSK